MFRKNWMLIVALAVWATLCPSGDGSFGRSSTPAAQQPSQPQQLELGPLNDALKNIESAIKAAQPEGKSESELAHDKEREQKTDEHETKDLNAQEEAAKAATANVKLATELIPWNKWQVVFTILATVATAIAAFAAARATQLAQRSIELNERPWIKIDAKVVGPLQFVLDGEGRTLKAWLISNLQLGTLEKHQQYKF